MNASKFMDKQIMELSGSSQPAGELFDLINPQEHSRPNGSAGAEGIKSEEQQREAEILPSYDFHPIRAAGSSPGPTGGDSGGGGSGGISGSWPSWGSVDPKLASATLKNAGILDPYELRKVSHGKEKKPYDYVEIDSTVKKYADNLMNALEVVSSRLSKLESRTHHVESSIDELKVAIGNNNGSTDGRLRQIEHVLNEVHSTVQILQDKQNTVEVQLLHAQLNASEGQQGQQQPENSKIVQPHSLQHEVPPLQNPIQQPYQHPIPQAPSTMHPSLPMPNAPQPAQQNPPPKIPSQLPQFQILSAGESYFPSAVKQVEGPNQQYPVHAQPPQTAPPPPPQSQHYHPSPQPPQYSHPPQPQQPVNPPPQLPPTMTQQHEEPLPYMPGGQSYPPSMRQSASFPQQMNTPPQQIYGPNSNLYEPPASTLNAGLPPFSSGYGPPPVASSYSDPYAYSGLPSGQNRAGAKPLPMASSVASGESNNYPRLPTAQILPQAAPVASGSGGSSGTKMPIDDVVEKVATMGFSRDQVRSTVRKLTENGQSVDLNVVLDKLMNDGGIQPQKGWFGR